MARMKWHHHRYQPMSENEKEVRAWVRKGDKEESRTHPTRQRSVTPDSCIPGSRSYLFDDEPVRNQPLWKRYGFAREPHPNSVAGRMLSDIAVLMKEREQEWKTSA